MQNLPPNHPKQCTTAKSSRKRNLSNPTLAAIAQWKRVWLRTKRLWVRVPLVAFFFAWSENFVFFDFFIFFFAGMRSGFHSRILPKIGVSKPRFSDRLQSQKLKLEEVGRQLGVKELDDWYKVSRLEVL